MTTSVQEYRELIYQVLTLPSGAQFLVYRKPQVAMFIGLGELPVPATTESVPGLTPLDIARNLQRFTDRAIAHGVVDPPITDEVDEGGKTVALPGVLHVRHLHAEDYAVLSATIFSNMGLVAEVAKDIESFRTDPERPTGESAGRDLPLPAERGREADANGTVPRPLADVSA